MKEDKKNFKKEVLPLISYVQTHEESFEEKPLNEVDALVFSEVCYLGLDGLGGLNKNSEWISFADFFNVENCEPFISKTYYPLKNEELIHSLVSSPRYRNVKMNYHVEIFDVDKEQQFSATTFLLPTGEMVIGFRGTDVSVVGWKESFNMATQFPVPCHVSSLQYTLHLAEKSQAPLYIIGHSKGGSMASYSYTHAPISIKNRTIKVYNFDGPGFPQDVEDGKYFKSDTEKIEKFIPEESIIGMLFESQQNVNVIKSKNIGFFQHDLFNWEIDGDALVVKNSLKKGIKRADLSINQWIYELSIEQRKVVIESVFAIVNELELDITKSVLPQLFKQRKKVRAVQKSMDKETVAYVKKAFKELIKLYAKTKVDKNG